MALSRITTWSSGQVLTAAAQNAEFDNILNNALSLISPLTGSLDFNGNRGDNFSKGSLSTPGLNFTADQNTGIHSSAADVAELVVGGVRGIQVTGVSTSAVNWLDFRNSLTGTPLTIAAEGTDTNINIDLVPAGTGYVRIATSGGYVAGAALNPGLALADGRAGLVQITSGTVTVVAELRPGFEVRGSTSATNYLFTGAAATGATPFLGVTGGDTNIGLVLQGKGSGVIQTATAFVATSFRGGGQMDANAMYSQSIAKAWAHVSVSGAAASLLTSFNVQSVTYNGLGDYTVTWHRPFVTNRYATNVTVHYPSGRLFAGVTDQSSTVCRVFTDTGAALADASFFIVAYGMQ